MPPSFPHSFSSSGTDLVVRYLQPADVNIFRSFFLSLQPETIRCRFGYMISGITDERANTMVSVDPLKDPALAVFNAGNSEIFAVGRYYLNPEEQSAEIAVVVSDSMRRRGLAKLVLKQLIDLAKSRGIKILHAFVLSTSAPILILLKSLGFKNKCLSEEGEQKLSLQL